MPKTSNVGTSFERWLEIVFVDTADPADDARCEDAWEELRALAPADELALTTETLERAAELPALLSADTLANGLWRLASELGALNHCIEGSLPVAARIRCVHAVGALYERLFAVECNAALSHLDEPGEPLNSACYMWWDIGPFGGRVSEPDAIAGACLDVMERTLAIGHDACSEGALHGLGHVHADGALEARRLAIVDRFLRGHRKSLRSELVAYACAARAGCVL